MKKKKHENMEQWRETVSVTKNTGLLSDSKTPSTGFKCLVYRSSKSEL